MKAMRILPFLVGGIMVIMLSTTSCLKDEYDFQNLTTSNYEPNIGIPLINTTFNFNDFLFDFENSGYLSTDSNDLLYISYTDTVARLKFNDVLDFPAQNSYKSFALPAFKIEDFAIDTAITLEKLAENMQEPEKSILQAIDGQLAAIPAISQFTLDQFTLPQNSDFEEAEFSKGTLSLTITNNLPIPVSNFSIEMRNSIDNSLIGIFDYSSISSFSSSTDQIDLKGVVIKYPFEVNITSLSSPGSSGALVNVDLQSELGLHFSTSGLEVIRGVANVKEQLLLTDTINVDIQMPNGEEIYSISLSSGKINYSIDYGMMLGAEIIVTFPYITLNGNALTETITINPQTSSTQLAGEIDLAGYTIDLTANNTTINNIMSEIQVSSTTYNNPVEVDTSDKVIFEFELNNMDISYAEGYIGEQSISLGEDTLYFPFERGSLLENIAVEDPRVTLYFNNSFGISGTASLLNTIFFNEQNNTLGLSGDIMNNPLTVSSPLNGQYGTVSQTTYTISNQNSNIKNVFALLPNKAIVNGIFSTNANSSQGLNFLGNLSELNLIMQLDIPVYGSLSRITASDTIEFDASAFDKIRSAVLKIAFDNGFPVDLDIQVHFADAQYNTLDSLVAGGAWLAKSAAVNTTGDVTANKTSFGNISVDETKMEALREASYIILNIGVATTDNGTTPVKFYTHYNLGLKLGIISQINL